MSIQRKSVSIKNWKEDDRPREKLLSKEKNTLSDAELIAILIGSGNREESAVGLAKRILTFTSNNLNQLGKLSVNDLTQFKGIGGAGNFYNYCLRIREKTSIRRSIRKTKN